jgi:hypothetical protein
VKGRLSADALRVMVVRRVGKWFDRVRELWKLSRHKLPRIVNDPSHIINGLEELHMNVFVILSCY